MKLLNKLFGKPSAAGTTEEIVEKLVQMRVVDRASWDEIRQWLGRAWIDLNQTEKNQSWLEVQEKARTATAYLYFKIAREKLEMSHEAATEFAGKWTNLLHFWFRDLDRPADTETHLLMLGAAPDYEIDLLVKEIERQDERVVQYVIDAWKSDPAIAELLRFLRRMQLEGWPTAAMNNGWDKIIFSLPDNVFPPIRLPS